MRPRNEIEKDLAYVAKGPATHRRLAGDVGPLLEQLDDLEHAMSTLRCDFTGNCRAAGAKRIAEAKVAERSREIERLKGEYAEHMSHASGRIHDAEAERDRLAAAVRTVIEHSNRPHDPRNPEATKYSAGWSARELLRAALDGVRDDGSRDA